MKTTFVRQMVKGLICLLPVCLMVTAANAETVNLIDDFNGPLNGFTQTVILDVNGGASNTSNFQITNGALEVATTAYDDIEQTAYIADGFSLDVGDELRVDISGRPSGNRNFGLYVGGTAPIAGVRQDYISIYGEASSDRVFQRGFDGTTEYTNLFADPTATIEYYFIARTAVNTFENGFFDGTRTIVTTLTPATANTADFIGFYTDVRAAGTLGAGDNLRIVSPAASIPEPGSLALLGLAGLAVVTRRRR